MKKRRLILIISIVAIVIIAAITYTVLANQREGSKGILYRVTGPEGTAYLLGSIHIGTSEMYPFGEPLQDAMAASDIFVFESDTESSASLQQLMARMFLPQGTSLRGVLGDDLMDEVLQAYNKMGLDANASGIDTQQPWVVISTLAVYSSAAEMGIKDANKAISLGVETAVQKYADDHHKQYAYLETMDEFADTMDSFSNELNQYLLQDEVNWILKQGNSGDASVLAQWPALWHDGDAEGFYASYLLSIINADQRLYQEYEDKIIGDRNVRMADRIDEMLQDGGNYFVTVGLLHLITEDGSIPSLLREKGYTVERIGQ